MSESQTGSAQRREKVCLFVDNCALFVALQRYGPVKLDYKRLRDWAGRQRDMMHATYYGGEVGDDASRRVEFYKVLERAGYRVSVCHNAHSHEKHAPLDPKVRAACLCAMVWDLCTMTLTGRYDTFIVVSGEMGLLKPLQWVQERGVEVELLFFEEDTDEKLRSKMDRFRTIDIGCVTMAKPARDGPK